ncbi:bifunctional DNA primase/polymerase [Streptomyces sp. NRRL B-24484]
MAAVARGSPVFPLPPSGRQPTPSGWHRDCLTDPRRRPALLAGRRTS